MLSSPPLLAPSIADHSKDTKLQKGTHRAGVDDASALNSIQFSDHLVFVFYLEFRPLLNTTRKCSGLFCRVKLPRSWINPAQIIEGFKNNYISSTFNLFMSFFHTFRIYECTNLFHDKVLVFFSSSCKVSFLVKINGYRYIFWSQ